MYLCRSLLGARNCPSGNTGSWFNQISLLGTLHCSLGPESHSKATEDPLRFPNSTGSYFSALVRWVSGDTACQTHKAECEWCIDQPLYGFSHGNTGATFNFPKWCQLQKGSKSLVFQLLTEPSPHSLSCCWWLSINWSGHSIIHSPITKETQLLCAMHYFNTGIAALIKRQKSVTSRGFWRN